MITSRFAVLCFTLCGMVGLSLVLFEVYATVLRARKRPGPLSEKLNRGLWWMATHSTRRLTRENRHAILESLGPLLLPCVALSLVALCIASFGLIYFPRMESFHYAHGAESTWREALYFSGVTLLTIGYGDVTPSSGLLQLLALMEGVSGLAILSLFTAYLLTVNEAVQNKRSAASSLYIQAAKGADVATLVIHHYRRGRFHRLDDLMRESSSKLAQLQEAHIEHPVLHYFHSAAIYKSFPRFLFVLLELTTILDTLIDRQACLELIDSPELEDLRTGTETALKELVVVLNLQETLESSAGPRFPLRRHQVSCTRALNTLKQAGIPVEADWRSVFEQYSNRRSEWEKALFVASGFLGYEWEELTGDSDLNNAYEDETAEVQLHSER